MKPNDSKQRTRRFWRDRPVVLAISVLVLVLGIVGTTLAYLFTNTDSITNTFTVATAGITVDEKLENGVKNDVTIKNTGDVDVYIRARVIVTWKDDEGNVSATAPVAGTDYTITYQTGTGWVEYEGNYYYTSSVAAGGPTGVLFTDCKPVEGKTPDGYHLSVEILADSIQAKPENAVQEAWGVKISADKVEPSDSYAGGLE